MLYIDYLERILQFSLTRVFFQVWFHVMISFLFLCENFLNVRQIWNVMWYCENFENETVPNHAVTGKPYSMYHKLIRYQSNFAFLSLQLTSLTLHSICLKKQLMITYAKLDKWSKNLEALNSSCIAIRLLCLLFDNR